MYLDVGVTGYLKSITPISKENMLERDSSLH
jgi:hypothetical protein